MLTHLRFKNWRSLRDVTIDNLTPLTVFIGANSSGKTNIVDAMSFLRRMIRENTPQAIYIQGERENIRTLGVDTSEPIELEFSLQSGKTGHSPTYTLTMQPEDQNARFIEHLTDGTGNDVFQVSGGHALLYPADKNKPLQKLDLAGLVFPQLTSLWLTISQQGQPSDPPEYSQWPLFVSQRWQLLRENYMPPTSIPIGEEQDAYLIERSARNVAFMLDFMEKTNQTIYGELRADLVWLLEHVENLGIEADERETRITIMEKVLRGQKGPTISGGTARILAMLTAYYALDLRLADLPGLLVIEEPDMAVHPELLKRLVDLFREYVTREGYPRQIILTTHNPQLLNWFEPEEVRVVERDEHGDTSVHGIPPYIKEIWLDGGKYGLGDVWMTRSLGGVPE